MKLKVWFLRLRYFSAKNGGRESVSCGKNGTWKDESWARICEQGCLPGIKNMSWSDNNNKSSTTERAMSVKFIKHMIEDCKLEI